MATYTLKDFSDLVSAIQEELGVQSSDTVATNRIKRDLNIVYLDEVVPFAKWWWMNGSTTVQATPYFSSGTANVQSTSTTVTLSNVVPVGQGSKAGYYFSVEGYDEVYEIASHTAGSATLTLSNAFTGYTSTAVGYKIWTNKINLPTDCKETISVRHDFQRDLMTPVGFTEFRRISTAGGRAEGRPAWYTTTDYVDPTTGDGEAESDRYRQLLIYPAITDKYTNLHIDYIKETPALELDGDEPIMPLEDRVVLLYGALERAWSKKSNPEEAARNRGLYERKLARMAGKLQDTQDKPKLTPSKMYLGSKRGTQRGGALSSGSEMFLSSGGGNPAVSYLEDVVINGATISGNVTVNSLVTIDGRDISVDGTAMDAHIAASTGVHGLTGAVVGTTDVQSLSNKSITLNSPNKALVTNASNTIVESVITTNELTYLDDVIPLTTVSLADNQSSAADVLSFADTFLSSVLTMQIIRGTITETLLVTVAHNGTSVSITPFGSSVGVSGVTLSATLTGGNVVVQYTSTSTGTAPSLKYKGQLI